MGQGISLELEQPLSFIHKPEHSSEAGGDYYAQFK